MAESHRRRDNWSSTGMYCFRLLVLVVTSTTIIESVECYGSFEQDKSLSNFLKDFLEEWGGGADNHEIRRGNPAQDEPQNSDAEIADLVRAILDENIGGASDRNKMRNQYFNVAQENGFRPEEDSFDYLKAYFQSNSNYFKVKDFLDHYQRKLHQWRRVASLASWRKETNLTKHNTDIADNISLHFSSWNKVMRQRAEKFSKAGLTGVQKRMLKLIVESDSPNEAYLRKRSSDLTSKISRIYSNAKVCKNTGKCYHFEPGLVKLFRTSRNYDELLWAWKGWRDAIGPSIRKDWISAMRISNIGAREHGYEDAGDYIRETYEVENFERDIDDLWEKLEPFYKELHAYVRYKLHQQYGDRVSLTGPIPAHLLGEMWAMKWDSLLKMVEPHPEIGGFEVTEGMKKQNMTVHRMFVLADKFYQSVGLPKMTPQFWNYSMFTRPKDNRPVVCYASAHNLEGDDVRIKMCAQVNSNYFYVVHHEMGHCQYYLAYNRHQPPTFQSGANHGFHEAIGDTAALSVISPTHLEKLGILEKSSTANAETSKKDLNFLMQKALGKLAFFPFAMTMAKWSWDVRRGVIPTTEFNAAWWKYRNRYQGITPPIERTEHDFDPGCKYHIANFVPYVRYFVSHVLQFQFYEALCSLAGYQGPLHRCDFANSTKAGEKFEKMLQMGSSKPWPEAMRVLTNTGKMKVDSVVRYFQPLLTWLKDENEKLGNKIGWD